MNSGLQKGLVNYLSVNYVMIVIKFIKDCLRNWKISFSVQNEFVQKMNAKSIILKICWILSAGKIAITSIMITESYLKRD